MKNKVFVQFNTVRKILCVILVALMTAFFSGCMQDEPDAAFSESEERAAVKKAAAEEYVLRDNDALYGVRADDSVITMYLTVSGGNEADNSNHTWKEINTYSAYDYEKMNVSRYKVEGILQIDTGDGLTEESFGYGENVPNVSVQIRGQTSSKLEYKSYKIRIKEGKGEFEGQRTLNLNGHYSNSFRFVNKLCFNLLEDIPQTLSLRTQFVQLYVKDLTEGKDSKFVDYGIYSMVEQVNKAYLNNRGFDENGQLYKLSLFEWENEPAVIAPEEDFDLDEFNGAMEMKGNTDRTKLLKTMSDLHNYRIPITETIEKYFDTENICYWMAFNILVGNYDTASRNMFWYSPENESRWYIISWDMDASFTRNYYRRKNKSEGLGWEQGITEFVHVVPFRRMLTEQCYRDMLDKAVEELYHGVLSPDNVDVHIKELSRVTKLYMSRLPGSYNTEGYTGKVYDDIVSKMHDEVTENYNIYKESLNWPWPFYVGTPTVNETGMDLVWDAAYDWRGDKCTYRYILARDYSFKNVISKDDGLTIPAVHVDINTPGVYFLKVEAVNESGYTIPCYDYYDISSGKAYGCYAFKVNKDYSVEVWADEEE